MASLQCSQTDWIQWIQFVMYVLSSFIDFILPVNFIFLLDGNKGHIIHGLIWLLTTSYWKQCLPLLGWQLVHLGTDFFWYLIRKIFCKKSFGYDWNVAPFANLSWNIYQSLISEYFTELSTRRPDNLKFYSVFQLFACDFYCLLMSFVKCLYQGQHNIWPHLNPNSSLFKHS